MRTVAHHLARKRDRVADARDACHGARIAGTAIHDRGVEFDVAVPGEYRAAPGVEQRIVLHRLDCGLDRIHRAAAFAQHLRARVERALQCSAIGRILLRRHIVARDGPCAAMNGDRPAGLVLSRGRYCDKDEKRGKCASDAG